jgi:hypothetical protein
MATATTTAYPDASSLANYNAWANWVYNQFIAFGWVQTADSGQQTWPATGSVPTSNTSYNIFQSQDSLTSSTPIYVKLSMYETSSLPQIQLTVGTGGTNGSGALNTPHITPLTFGCGLNETSALLNCYASGDSGSIRFVLFAPSGNGPNYPYYYYTLAFVVSRSYNSTGQRTGNYVMVWELDDSLGYYQTVYNPVTTGTNNQDTSGYAIAALPYRNASTSIGGVTMVAPVFQNIGGLTNPTPDFLLAKSVDFPDEAAASATIYGTAHNYIPIQLAAGPWSNGNGTAGNSFSWLFRFE